MRVSDIAQGDTWNDGQKHHYARDQKCVLKSECQCLGVEFFTQYPRR